MLPKPCCLTVPIECINILHTGFLSNLTLSGRSAIARIRWHRRQDFGLRFLTRRVAQDGVEYFAALVFQQRAFRHLAAIDVHVVDNAMVDFGFGRGLDRRRQLAAIG